MDFWTAIYTDIGTTKKINQDSICLKIAQTSHGKVAFCVLCDGMGGLSSGELASASVVLAFSDWFNIRLPILLKDGFTKQQIKDEWFTLASSQNDLLTDYGKKQQGAVGTTLAVILIIKNEYYAASIGDTRIYMLEKATVSQISRDHSLVAQELEKGLITPEQAKKDFRLNILSQCIGVTDEFEPDFYNGTFSTNKSFVLCTDGFWHLTSKENMLDVLSPFMIQSEDKLEEKLQDMVRLCMIKGERDNITVGLINVRMED